MIRIEIKYEQHNDDGLAQIRMDVIKGVDTLEVEKVIARLLQNHFVTVSDEAGMRVEITEEI